MLGNVGRCEVLAYGERIDCGIAWETIQRVQSLDQRSGYIVAQVGPRNGVRGKGDWERGRRGSVTALGHERASGQCQRGPIAY